MMTTSSTTHSDKVSLLTEALSNKMLQGQFVVYAQIVAKAFDAAAKMDKNAPKEVVWEPLVAANWSEIDSTVFEPEGKLRWNLDTKDNRVNITHMGLNACFSFMFEREAEGESVQDLHAAFAVFLERALLPALQDNGITMGLNALGGVVFKKVEP